MRIPMPAPPPAEVGYLLPFNEEALLAPFGALLDMLNSRRLCRCAVPLGYLWAGWVLGAGCREVPQ